MENTVLFWGGALIGVSVAAPVGPMGVLCIRRTLLEGLPAGLSTGAGASTVHVFYCSALILGLHQIAPWLDGNRKALSLFGAVMMLLFAWTLLRTRKGATKPPRVAAGSLLVAYLTAIAFNLANPMTMLLLVGAMAAIFGAVPPVGVAGGVMLLGLLAGSLAWWVCLSSATALLRSRLGGGVLARVNSVAAVALIGFSLVALARVLRA